MKSTNSLWLWFGTAVTALVLLAAPCVADVGVLPTGPQANPARRLSPEQQKAAEKRLAQIEQENGRIAKQMADIRRQLPKAEKDPARRDALDSMLRTLDLVLSQLWMEKLELEERIRRGDPNYRLQPRSRPPANVPELIRELEAEQKAAEEAARNPKPPAPADGAAPAAEAAPNAPPPPKPKLPDVIKKRPLPPMAAGEARATFQNLHGAALQRFEVAARSQQMVLRYYDVKATRPDDLRAVADELASFKEACENVQELVDQVGELIRLSQQQGGPDTSLRYLVLDAIRQELQGQVKDMAYNYGIERAALAAQLR